MEKAKFSKSIGELMVNGKRFTHPDFQTGLSGHSPTNVVSQMRKLIKEMFSSSFIKSNKLDVNVSCAGFNNEKPIIVHLG